MARGVTSQVRKAIAERHRLFVAELVRQFTTSPEELLRRAEERAAEQHLQPVRMNN